MNRPALSWDIEWDGNPHPDASGDEVRKLRKRLADAARGAEWKTVLRILQKNNKWVNSARPGGLSLYTPLHHAANQGAPVEVVEKLLSLGAWRTIRNRDGDRPVDLARQRNHDHLLPVLEPIIRNEIPSEALQEIQRHFHLVIHKVDRGSIERDGLRLPQLEPLTEYEPGCRCLFEVWGMCGGYIYWFEKHWDSYLLISESWNSVIQGSGEQYIVTPFGDVLVAQGFV